jgi:hypothetical protein
MDYIFRDWQDRLSRFESSVKKDLAEIRQCKAEIQQMKLEMANEQKGRFISDDQRLILSAPEIIIGHVDQGGALLEGKGSVVVVRGTKVDVHGIGEGGRVDIKASCIRQTAEDPGSDGHEHVVYPSSRITSQARNITLQSNDADGLFSDIPGTTGGSGILIHSDAELKVEASVSRELKEKRLSELIGQLKERSSNLQKQAMQHKLSFGLMVAEMEKLLTERKLMLIDDVTVRSSYDVLQDLNEKVDLMSLQLSEEVRSYADVLSLLAETSRQLKCLDEEKKTIKQGDAFKKASTGARVSIAAEQIAMVSVDGDGNLRDNKGAGLSVKATDISLEAVEADGSLKKEGRLRVNTRNVEISTANNTDMKYDEKNGEIVAATHLAEGDVVIKSKTITLESTDYETADKELKEKVLTKDGHITIRAEKTCLSAADTEGKATGSISLNAKDINLKAMDTDKDSHADKEAAKDGCVKLLAENMFIGEKDKSKQLQTFSETVTIAADKELKALQGEDKAVVTLNGENISVKGNKVGMKGDTTIEGKTAIKGDMEINGSEKVSGDADVKGEVKGSQGTFNKLEAKMSFKSRNIMD